MSTATAPRVSGSATPRPATTAPLLRAVLTGYARTLLVPLLGLVALLVSWTVAGTTGWGAAVAAVVIWAAGSAAWLRRRAWSRAVVHLVTWAAPAALLAPLAALGWLSADGLVLWGPVTAVLAVCLAVIRQPLPRSRSLVDGASEDLRRRCRGA